MSENSEAATGFGRVARATCLGFLVLTACDGSKGPGDGGIPPLPGRDAAASACGSFNACGGSVVGTWQFQYPAAIECGPSSIVPASCPGYSRTGELRETVTMTFSTDGTSRTAMVADGAYQVSYPLGCEGVSSCPTSGGQPGATMTCGENPPGTCRCDYVFDNFTFPGDVDTYTTSGGTLTTVDSDDGSVDTMEYCVQGNTMRVHMVEDSGVSIVVRFTKQ